MESLDPQLQELLAPYKQHFALTEGGKLQCSLNGHTLPPRPDALRPFIQGAKFQKLFRRATADSALQKYEPFIVPSANFPLMLYCALTGQLIDRSVEAVKQHMKGKKFQRAKERFASDDLELKPEPSLASFGVRLPKDAAAQNGGDGSGAPAAAAAAAAGAGAEDEDGAFWVPSDEASGSEEAEDEAEEADEGADGSGSEGSEDGAGATAANGAGSDAVTAEPMDEDQPAAAPVSAGSKQRAGRQQRKAKAAAAAGGAAGSGKRRQQPAAAKQQQPVDAAAAKKKKQNAKRPPAAKRAKH